MVDTLSMSAEDAVTALALVLTDTQEAGHLLADLGYLPRWLVDLAAKAGTLLPFVAGYCFRDAQACRRFAYGELDLEEMVTTAVHVAGCEPCLAAFEAEEDGASAALLAWRDAARQRPRWREDLDATVVRIYPPPERTTRFAAGAAERFSREITLGSSSVTVSMGWKPEDHRPGMAPGVFVLEVWNVPRAVLKRAIFTLRVKQSSASIVVAFPPEKSAVDGSHHLWRLVGDDAPRSVEDVDSLEVTLRSPEADK